jgi:hypothetical protein
MPPASKLRQSGGVGRKKGAQPGGRGANLSAGLRGLSQIAGNQALIAMMARRKTHIVHRPQDEQWGDPHREADVADTGEREAALAALKVLLDGVEDKLRDAADEKRPEKAGEALHDYLFELMMAFHRSLEGVDGYDLEFEAEVEKLMESRHNVDEDRAAGLAHMLEAITERGFDIHNHLVDTLPKAGQEHRAETPKISSSLVGGLADELRKRREQAEQRRPERKLPSSSSNSSSHGAVDQLLKKRKLR